MSESDQGRKAARQELLVRLGPTTQHAANNMLTVLTGTADVLRRTAKDPQSTARADRIADATTRLERLLRGYLTLARRPVPDDAPADLGLLLNRLGAVFELFLHRGTTLAIEAPTGLPMARIDFTTFDMALVDLVAETAPRLAPVLRLALASSSGRLALRIEGLPADAPTETLERIARDAGGTAAKMDGALLLELPQA